VTPSVEWAAALVLIGLYVFDCVLTLFRGQGVLCFAGGSWSLAFGSVSYTVRDKAVLLLNPFAPWQGTLLTQRLFEPPAPGALRVSTALRGLAPLRWAVMLQAALVLVALPYLMFRNAAIPLFGVLTIAYVNVIAMLAMIARVYLRLGVARAPLWGIAAGALLCLPLSVNVMRHALLRMPVAGDASRLVRLLPASRRADARRALRMQVVDALQLVPVDAPVHAALIALQRSLDERIGHDRP
jgi:hypothetical protein